MTLESLRTEKRSRSYALPVAAARGICVSSARVARGEAHETSDQDLLVDWEAGRSLQDHAGLVQDLEELLGINVHLGTEKALHWYVPDRILHKAIPL